MKYSVKDRLNEHTDIFNSHQEFKKKIQRLYHHSPINKSVKVFADFLLSILMLCACHHLAFPDWAEEKTAIILHYDYKPNIILLEMTSNILSIRMFLSIMTELT